MGNKNSGRHSKMTPEIQERVLELIATGHSVQQIEKRDGIPEEKSIYGLLIRDPVFAEKYARAREAQQEVWANRALDIALGRDPAVVDMDANERRLVIDTIKWQAGKLAPKKYGDTARVAHTGPSGDGPVQIEMQVIDPATLAPEAMAQIQEALSLAIEAQEAPDEEE